MSMDDVFFHLVKDIEIDFDYSEIENIKELTTEDIVDRIQDIEYRLFSSSQALHPSNQESRDLHSLRNALQIELRRRSK